jgi:triosephosphate isomerase
MPRRPLAAGNWKMNGLTADLGVVAAIRAEAQSVADRVDVALCLPAPLIDRAVQVAGAVLAIGGQDCHAANRGAHTGDTSAALLADVGARLVIVGHSERRTDHSETSAQVAAKAQAAWRHGLTAIVCIGETEAERDAGRTLAVVLGQLKDSLPDGATAATTVIAYEPVWAIGTGRTPTTADVAEVHSAIRRALVVRFGVEGQGMRILYGGSVKPSNASELMAVADVDGALVGGASLTHADFAPIIAACVASAARSE